MFVAVTLLAAWLGWNLHWVNARGAMLERIYQHQGLVDEPEYRQIALYGHTYEHTQVGGQLPTAWRLLGARPVRLLDIHRQEFTPEERTRIRSLFPEADIAEWYFTYLEPQPDLPMSAAVP